MNKTGNMKLKNGILFASMALALMVAASCSKDKDKPAPKDPAQTILIKDLPADPSTRDATTGEVIGGTNHYTFFRFSDSTVVPLSDSASTKWDIGVRGTSIIMNSGISGPGKVEGQVVASTLADITAAPESGYSQDGSTGNVFAGWYNYNMEQHVVSSKPGYILVIHTNDGKYVKMEVLSYYKGAPAQPTNDDISGYYTFRYVYQPDGTRNFNN